MLQHRQVAFVRDLASMPSDPPAHDRITGVARTDDPGSRAFVLPVLHALIHGPSRPHQSKRTLQPRDQDDGFIRDDIESPDPRGPARRAEHSLDCIPAWTGVLA